MHVGNRNRIDLGSSSFSSFIKEDILYVDKTSFVEHVLDDASRVLLFCRPRRMGKTLNLDTLRTFLDVKGGAAAQGLFSGLAIGESPHFSKANSRPVIWLSFRDLGQEGYRTNFRFAVEEQAERYLGKDQYSSALRAIIAGNDEALTTALKHLTKSIHTAYGIEPYLLIDEYDKLVMHPEQLLGKKRHDEHHQRRP
ncbi:MAG: AAA family ATPase [Coriobacteriales bacterium]|jgi:hypothetical protein|nr:AAA family ATPase [Coriobacteriales bacterium]